MKAHISLNSTGRIGRLEAEKSRVAGEAPVLTLLCPGPVQTTNRVRLAMARGDIAHRDEAFVALLDSVRARLLAVAHAVEHEVLVLGGGGTAATEAAMATFIAPEERLLVVSNGAFGERMAEIAAVLGIPVSHLRYDWGEPIVLEQITGMLQGDPRIKTLAMVHHETSVGRVNPVVEVGRLLAPMRVRFMVDVVSSLGGEEFDTMRARASIVIGSANKCLHGVPGVGFVMVKHDMWRETSHVRPRSMYLDLRRYRASAKENGQTPFTPSVQVISALDEALRELEDSGGVSARQAHYQILNNRIRSGLRSMGLRLYFDGPGSAASLTVAHLPPGLPFDRFYAELRVRGFVVYRGKGPISHDCFLVANMGDLNLPTVDAFLVAVSQVADLPLPESARRAQSLPA